MAAPRKLYGIEAEFPVGDTVRYYTLVDEVDEASADRIRSAMKRCGIGGRKFWLDGAPAGHLEETWPGVDRLAKAGEIEKAALDGWGAPVKRP